MFQILFQKGYFPVNIKSFKEFDIIYSMKTSPELFTKEQVITLMDEYEKKVNTAYDSIKYIYKYKYEHFI